MSPFLVLLWRDVKLATRSGGGAALTLCFFALVATLVPLGIGAHLEHCDLSRANLEGTSWHRATLAHCVLRGAALIDARIEQAVFSDCDLRGADLAIARSPNVATLAGARFVRCDLRDTRWEGRELGGAAFVDCVANSMIAGRRQGIHSAP